MVNELNSPTARTCQALDLTGRFFVWTVKFEWRRAGFDSQYSQALYWRGVFFWTVKLEWRRAKGRDLRGPEPNHSEHGAIFAADLQVLVFSAQECACIAFKNLR